MLLIPCFLAILHIENEDRSKDLVHYTVSSEMVPYPKDSQEQNQAA
jgi:hypothetical protein